MKDIVRSRSLSAVGVEHYRAGRLEPALAAFEAALHLDPASVLDQVNRASVLGDLGRFDEALQAIGLAEAVAVGNPQVVAHLRRVRWSVLARQASAVSWNGEPERAVALFGEAAAADPADLSAAAARVGSLHYLPDQPVERLFDAALGVGRLARQVAGPPAAHAHGDAPDRRLRIGFVSVDFRRHPVARFLSPLAALDPAQFELYAYSGTARHDDFTERFRRLLPNWRDVARLPDVALAEMIRSDRIDILVDLNGFSGGGRIGALALRPAPILVNWLGYTATCGLDCVDYVLASDTVLPQEHEGQWVERPWRLPQTYLAFDPAEPTPEVGPLPALQRGVVTFGSYNNFRKLNVPLIADWVRILERVPDSALRLRTSLGLSDARRREITGLFASAGIDGHRVELAAAIEDYGAHMASYSEIDIALDTYPFNGATTSCEALWMGVPVVTRVGDRYVSRMGNNIMQAIGRPEWVAGNADGYVDTAVRLAGDLRLLAAERAGLRQRFRASAMADIDGFARELGRAFRQMWRIWCQTT